jgi:two-component system, NarL family, response regulator
MPPELRRAKIVRVSSTKASSSSGTVWRVIVADDHALFRDGVVHALRLANDMEVVAEVADGAAAVEAYFTHQPDAVLLDLQMPRMSGVEAVRRIRSTDANARIIVLTTYDIDDDIEQCLRAGAKAYLLKDVNPDELISCVRDVCAGRTRLSPEVAAKLADRYTQVALTPREFNVLRQMALGHSNRAIGEELSIAEATVKVHVTRLLEKLNASSRTEAVAIATRRGLIRPT